MSQMKKILNILKNVDYESFSQFCASDVELFFSDKSLVNSIELSTIARFRIGNKYLLQSNNYTKILEWLLNKHYLTTSNSVYAIINRIEETPEYTYTIVLLLCELHLFSLARKILLHNKIIKIIEEIIINIPNFNINELLLLKKNMMLKCQPIYNICIKYDMALTELLLMHNTHNNDIQTLDMLREYKFKIAEPERFTFL